MSLEQSEKMPLQTKLPAEFVHQLTASIELGRHWYGENPKATAVMNPPLTWNDIKILSNFMVVLNREWIFAAVQALI